MEVSQNFTNIALLLMVFVLFVIAMLGLWRR